MPNFDTQLFSEVTEVIGQIAPASYNSAQNSAYINAGQHRRFVAILHVGVISATGTLDARLRIAKDGTGTGEIDLSGKAMPQLAAGTINKPVILELKSDEIPDGYTHIRLVVTPATAASLVGAVVLGLEPRFSPVPLTNVQAVVV